MYFVSLETLSTSIIWDNSAWDIAFSSIYLFNNLFISVWTQRYLFSTLSYNPLLLYCSNRSSFGQWELFSWLLCSFQIPTHQHCEVLSCFIVLFSFCHYKVLRSPFVCKGISHFFKELRRLSLENSIRNQDPDTRNSCCCWAQDRFVWHNSCLQNSQAFLIQIRISIQ